MDSLSFLQSHSKSTSIINEIFKVSKLKDNFRYENVEKDLNIFGYKYNKEIDKIGKL